MSFLLQFRTVFGLASLGLCFLVGGLSSTAQDEPIRLVLDAVPGPPSVERGLAGGAANAAPVAFINNQLILKLTDNAYNGTFYRWNGSTPVRQPFADLCFDCTQSRPTFCDPNQMFRPAGSCPYTQTQLFFKADPLGPIWRTDGTTAGTRQVMPAFSETLGPIGESMLFTYDDGVHGLEPWISDGTANGAQLLVDTIPGPEGIRFERRLVRLESLTLIATDTGFWKTQGTPQSTVPLPGIPGTPRPIFFSGRTPLGDRALLRRPCGATRCHELQALDAQTGSMQTLGSFESTPSEISFERTVPNRVLFIADRPGTNSVPQPWVTDGSPAGTRPLADFSFLNVNTAVGAGAIAGPSGSEKVLVSWNEGGSASLRAVPMEGGQMVDLLPALGVSGLVNSIHGSVSAEGIAAVRLLVDSGPLAGSRLAITDGTADGSFIVPGISRFDEEMVPFGNEIFFIATTSEDGRELFAIGDDAASLRIAFESAPGPATGFPVSLVPTPLGVVLTSTRGNSGGELWIVDNSGNPPHQLTETLGFPSLAGNRFIEIPGGFAFNGIASPVGYGIWTTDGSASGTRLRTGQTPIVDFQGLITRAGDRILFRGERNSNGVPATLSLDPSTGQIQALTEVHWFGVRANGSVGDAFITQGCFQSAECEPQGTDGTPSGTRRLVDTVPGPEGPIDLGVFDLGDGTALLHALVEEGAAASTTLYRTDGSPAGTQRVGELDGRIRQVLRQSPRKLWLRVESRNQETELWDLDLATGDTTFRFSLSAFEPASTYEFAGGFGGTLYFETNNPPAGPAKLWATEGDRDSTRVLLGNQSEAEGFVVLGKALFGVVVAQIEQVAGVTLWKTDGTAAGTLHLEQEPALARRIPLDTAATNENLFFAWGNLEAGREVWITNGSPEGTHLYADIAPGPGSSDPKILGIHDSRLLVSAFHPRFGQELWSIILPTALAKPGRALVHEASDPLVLRVERPKARDDN